MKRLSAIFLILAVTIPFSFIITVILFPLWSWLEASSKIESVGHSGTAEWCYYLIYFLVTGGLLAGFWSVKYEDGD